MSQVALRGLAALEGVSSSLQFSVATNLPSVPSNPVSKSLKKMLKVTGPRMERYDTPLVNGWHVCITFIPLKKHVDFSSLFANQALLSHPKPHSKLT